MNIKDAFILRTFYEKSFDAINDTLGFLNELYTDLSQLKKINIATELLDDDMNLLTKIYESKDTVSESGLLVKINGITLEELEKCNEYTVERIMNFYSNGLIEFAAPVILADFRSKSNQFCEDHKDVLKAYSMLTKLDFSQIIESFFNVYYFVKHMEQYPIDNVTVNEPYVILKENGFNIIMKKQMDEQYQKISRLNNENKELSTNLKSEISSLKKENKQLNIEVKKAKFQLREVTSTAMKIKEDTTNEFKVVKGEVDTFNDKVISIMALMVTAFSIIGVNIVGLSSNVTIDNLLIINLSTGYSLITIFWIMWNFVYSERRISWVFHMMFGVMTFVMIALVNERLDLFVKLFSPTK